ncbi:MAG: hypothetical protein QGF67_09340 [Lentisphaeria bacterium]|jgi:hypothetical protein|nr:hypothetical protein [Lentisphaeria bacterium]MDP7741631.1 hypothetical protein [Lentisphaeria bacterium]
MNRLKNPLVCSLVFVVIVLAVFQFESVVLDRLVPLDKSVKVNWIYSHAGTFDYAFVGSSAAYTGIDGKALSDTLGGSVINLGLDGTAHPEQYMVLAAFLESNDVGTIILQVDAWGLDENAYGYPFHEYLHLPYLDKPVVAEVVAERRGGRLAAWKYVPFLKYAEFNTEIGVPNVVHMIGGRQPEFDVYGSSLRNQAFNQAELEALAAAGDHHSYAWSTMRAEYFERMLDLARKKGIPVVVYLTPEYHEVLDYSPSRHQVVSYYRETVAAAGQAFLTYDDEPLCRDRLNFYNTSHLNRDGAGRFAPLLARDVLAASGRD